MNGMKNKIWVVFMEKDNAFHMKFTEKDTIIVGLRLANRKMLC